MSNSFYKNYSVHVATPVPFDAYWTMNESGLNTPRYDSINNTPFYTDGSAILGYPAYADMGDVPGKYGNALAVLNPDTNQIYQPTSWTGLPNPSMTTSGNALSLAFWLKKSRWGYGTLTDLVPSFGVGIAVLNGPDVRIQISLSFLQGSTTPPAEHQCGVWMAQPLNLFTDIGATFPVLFDVWEFWHLSCDANGNFSVSRNGSAELHIASYAPIAGDFTNYQISFGSFYPALPEWRFNNGAIDEVYFRGGLKFTPTQIAYLYNGGAGRTWPIVLPP